MGRDGMRSTVTVCNGFAKGHGGGPMAGARDRDGDDDGGKRREFKSRGEGRRRKTRGQAAAGGGGGERDGFSEVISQVHGTAGMARK
eukprot:315685-Hanusia_phi.AAC.1